MAADNGTAIRLSNISKAFNGNLALSGVSITLRKGTVHCIVGENGAGKSTLIKILTGAYIPDSGEIVYGDKTFKRLTPLEASKAGIVAVYQENVLAEQLSVAQNIFAGREPVNRAGFVSFREMEKKTTELSEKYGIRLTASALVESLTPAQKQFVKILKSISVNPQVLILDEPTAMLNIKDNQKVLELVHIFRNEGACVVYITHQLSEVLAVADEITVLRDGHVISTRSNTDAQNPVTPQSLTQDMVGRSMELLYKKQKHPEIKTSAGDELFRVEELRIAGFDANNSFTVHRGEIVGITGMVGSGRTELLEGIFGYCKKTAGGVFFKGKRIEIRYPADAIARSIGFITEDRQLTGLGLELSVAHNITCAAMNIFPGIFIAPAAEKQAAVKAAAETNVKCASVLQAVRELSGGNQQKVLLSRWILKGFDLILLDEPTKGVDINAKYEIYALLEELVNSGRSVLMVSSDMPEVISLCDRVLIMRKGHICGELSGGEIAENNIINMALGVE